MTANSDADSIIRFQATLHPHEHYLGPLPPPATTWPTCVIPAESLKLLGSISFDMFRPKLTADEILCCVYHMFDELGCIQALPLQPERLRNFLLRMRCCYRNVPFHNWWHAFNVTQALFSYLVEFELRKYFSPVELFSLLISCICHDTDHPGLNNTFQNNLPSALALRYNDTAVLESHHCSMTFQAISSPGCDLLADMPLQSRKDFREFGIACILSTDLASHRSYIDKIKAICERPAELRSKWQESRDERKSVMCCLVKSADVSNETRADHRISQCWAAKVMCEFYSQGDLEKQLGMPVAPINDRAQTSTPKGQIGFIQFLAMPLFREMALLFPPMQLCVDNMLQNAAAWEGVSPDWEASISAFLET